MKEIWKLLLLLALLLGISGQTCNIDIDADGDNDWEEFWDDVEDVFD